MKKTKEKLLLGVFVLMSACAFSVAYAQEEDTDLLQSQTVPAQQGSQESAPTGELTSCFDYYRFGSVPVELSAETVRVAQGADLKIQGKVTNQNDYRVDDITVYGKIYYKKNFEKSSFGPDIIQMFPLAENISLEAGEEKTFTYVYHIPAALKPGNYQVAAFVVSHDRFNMAGLSFTSDVVGSLLNFSVVGEDRGSVYFDNTKTVLNNIPFHSAIFPPRSAVPIGGLPLSGIIVNTTPLAVSGKVHWKVYSWDSMNAQNLIEEADTPVMINPSSQTSIAYNVQDKSHTVYYVIGELILDGSSAPVSSLQVRYVHTGPEALSLPRLGFLGVTGYPAEKEKTKAFVCIHSTGASNVKTAKVVLTVKSLPQASSGLGKFLSGEAKEMMRREYTGVIPGRMSALALPFSDSMNSFSVTAELYNDDKLLDTVTIDYPCLSSGASECKATLAGQGTQHISRSGIAVAIIAGVPLLVFALAWLWKKKNKTKR